MPTFQGRVALVTGGARGIGRVVSTRLAESGARVIINCFHSYAAGKQLRDELASRGLEVDLVRCSVAKEDQVAKMFDDIRQRHGVVDLLVNNAASGTFATSDMLTEADWDRAFATNLKGAFWCARHARALMPRGGAIVNLTSLGSAQVNGNYVTVGVSKAALESLTRYLAVEYAADGIRVNAASAALIEGEAASKFPHSRILTEAVVASTPLGRLGRPEDIVGLILYLLSDDAGWVTGQTVVADGGISIMPYPLDVLRALEEPSGPAPVPATEGTAKVRAPAAEARKRPGPSEPRPSAKSGAPTPGEARCIAVVGMGLVTPGANNTEEYWQALSRGDELFGESPRFRPASFHSADSSAEDKAYQTQAGFVRRFVPHPWLERELRELSHPMDYTAQWLRHALHDAISGVTLPPADRLNCMIGYTADGSHHLEEVLVVEGLLERLAAASEQLGWDGARRDVMLREARERLLRHYPHARAALTAVLPYQVGLQAIRGLLPDATVLMMIDTACSSSLYAVDIALKGIVEGAHDMAICGGSFAAGPRSAVLFAKLHGLSTSGRSRPLDRDCDGVLFSDGAAVMALKRLDLARRDGDPILGYVSAVATSSDGKGKAIYAPNVRGQRLCIQRAKNKFPALPDHVDWVVAHATGTPEGDLCEVTSLREELPGDKPVQVTSNKAIVGHTGWAAGAVSLIQVLLSHQRGQILPQHRFAASPPRVHLEKSRLRVPTEPVDWPVRDDGARTASVSGFGFGGTNAHVVLEDRPRPQPPVATEEDTVLVAWAAHLPGLEADSDVAAWLTGERPAPDTSFGPHYQPSIRILMPPVALRTLDRSQLMALECAGHLRRQLEPLWDAYRATMGVFVGHMGPTLHSGLYAERCYLDDVWGVLPADEDLKAAVRNAVRRSVPAANEDSFPGIMPNIVAARVANYHDLNGPNITVDAGVGSVLAAIEVAARYLRSNDVDVALVGGVNGNSSPAMRLIARALGDGVDRAVAEGAAMFALVRESLAVEKGLPVLARFGSVTAADRGQDPDARRVDYGLVPPHDVTYLGADGAFAILRALVGGLGSDTVITSHEGDGRGSLSLVLRPAGTSAPPVAQQETAGAIEPPGELLVRRYVPRWQPTANDRVRPRATPFPPDSVVLTPTPDVLGPLGTHPDDPLVLTTAPCAGVRRRHVTDLSAEAVRAALGEGLERVNHVRVVADLERMGAARCALLDDAGAFLRFHELIFLTLQALEKRLNRSSATVLALALNSVAWGRQHPFAGLYTGLVKATAHELPEAFVTGVCTSEATLEPGLEQLLRESESTQFLHVAVYSEGIRHTLTAEPVPPVPGPRPPLGPDSVVVAVGGGRGITGEIMKAVAARYRPVIYVLSSTPVEELKPELERRGGAAAVADRAKFLQAERARRAGRPPREAIEMFQRLKAAATILGNLAEMRKHCGDDRVRYLQGDVFNYAQLEHAFKTVWTDHETIDLLIHAAGTGGSAALATKTLRQFRYIRGLKVDGYLNLRRVLRGREPRVWCNFGSVAALRGQAGEIDYTSANDFLVTAAEYVRAEEGRDECTIGFTRWRDDGFVAGPVYDSFFSGVQAGVLSPMSTPEGIFHFLSEIEAANRTASTFHLGEVDRGGVERTAPNFFAPRRPFDVARAPFVDRVLMRTERELIAERRFDDERDAYLLDHRVGDRATLPGTFVTELAAEAAMGLLPGLRVVGFRDVEFRHFLKLGGTDERSPKRIHAALVRRDAAGGPALVQVSVVGDVLSPAGVVLEKDRVHYRVTVVMADTYPPAPRWKPWPDAEEMPVEDPYHMPGAPVTLRGVFESTCDTRLHPLGRRATYTRPVAPGGGLDGFVMPCVLMDGLARLGALAIVDGRYLPVVAPTGIRRIDVHAPGNDAEWGARYPQVDLYAARSTTAEPMLGGSRLVAAEPDGRILLQIKDATGVVMGYMDLHERRGVPASEVTGGSVVESVGVVPV